MDDAARPDRPTTARGTVWKPHAIWGARQKRGRRYRWCGGGRGPLLRSVSLAPSFSSRLVIPTTRPAHIRCGCMVPGNGKPYQLTSSSPTTHTTPTASIYACHAWRWKTYKEQGVIMVGLLFPCLPAPTQQGHSQWRNKWGFPPHTMVSD